MPHSQYFGPSAAGPTQPLEVQMQNLHQQNQNQEDESSFGFQLQMVELLQSTGYRDT